METTRVVLERRLRQSTLRILPRLILMEVRRSRAVRRPRNMVPWTSISLAILRLLRLMQLQRSLTTKTVETMVVRPITSPFTQTRIIHQTIRDSNYKTLPVTEFYSLKAI